MTTNFLDLQTSPELLSKLRNAADGAQSATEIFEQRVSFVLGSMKEGSGVTREQVRKVILDQAGHP
jgi:hypothetical protein